MRLSFALALITLALTSACGDEPRAGEAACAVGEEMTETSLFFGFGRKGAPPVSVAEWQEFLDATVTPLFKEGLTVIDGYGQYLGMEGDLAKEDSRVLILLYDGSAARSKDIEAIREAYKMRFDQESVLRVDEEVCASF